MHISPVIKYAHGFDKCCLLRLLIYFCIKMVRFLFFFTFLSKKLHIVIIILWWLFCVIWEQTALANRHENTALVLWTCGIFMASSIYSRITQSKPSNIMILNCVQINSASVQLQRAWQWLLLNYPCVIFFICNFSDWDNFHKSVSMWKIYGL